MSVKLLRVEPPRALTLERWYLALGPDGPGRTRLYARSRNPHGAVAPGCVLLFELPHFVMKRRMLRAIRRLAEERTGGQPR